MVVSHCKEKFSRFISRFVDASMADDEHFTGVDIEQPYYLQRLDEVIKVYGFFVLFFFF